MKSQILLTVWCNISGEAAGEIWHWSLSGVKGLKHTLLFFRRTGPTQCPISPLVRFWLTFRCTVASGLPVKDVRIAPRAKKLLVCLDESVSRSAALSKKGNTLICDYTAFLVICHCMHPNLNTVPWQLLFARADEKVCEVLLWQVSLFKS